MFTFSAKIYVLCILDKVSKGDLHGGALSSTCEGT
jgi:hypothetical protein